MTGAMLGKRLFRHAVELAGVHVRFDAIVETFGIESRKPGAEPIKIRRRKPSDSAPYVLDGHHKLHRCIAVE
jgi:hypothetical protein